MAILAEVAARNAPRKVCEAAQIIDECVAARRRPPADLVLYVQRWAAQAVQQNRWGK